MAGLDCGQFVCCLKPLTHSLPLSPLPCGAPTPIFAPVAAPSVGSPQPRTQTTVLSYTSCSTCSNCCVSQILLIMPQTYLSLHYHRNLSCQVSSGGSLYFRYILFTCQQVQTWLQCVSLQINVLCDSSSVTVEQHTKSGFSESQQRK